MDWQDLLRQLGSTTIVLAVLGYAGRRVIDKWLAERLQQHKGDLDAASDRALERIRYDLRLAEAKQSRLIAKQATIVAGVFARLERLHEALTVLAAPINHGETGAVPLRDAAVEAFNDFAKYYHQRAIWLDIATCHELNELVKLLATLLTKMNYNLLDNGQIADRTRWLETYERLEKEVPAARTALDKQFRALIGVGGNGSPETD